MADPDEPNGTINIRNQAAMSLLGNFVDTAISFGGIVLFANVLGADGLGMFYVVLAIVKVALFPVNGIGQSVMKRGSEEGLKPEVFLGGGLVYGSVYGLLIGSAISTVFVIDASLLRYSPRIVAVAFVVFLSRILFVLLLDALRSHGKTGHATITDNVHGILETTLQVVLLLAGYEVFGLLAGTAITSFLMSAGLLAVSDVRIGRPEVDDLRSILRFARWSVVTSGLGTGYDRLPVLVLGILLGNVAAGYYTSAMRLLMLGSYVGGSIAPALMVRASASAGAAAGERLSDLELSLQYAAVLAIPIMFGSFAIPGALMRTIFGPTFGPAGPVLIGLSIYHVINTFDTVTYSFFDGMNRPEYATRGTIVSLCVRIAAIGILILEFGVLGVVAAVVVSHAVHLIVAQFLLDIEFGQTVLPIRVVLQIAAGGIMWLVVSALGSFVSVESWYHLLAIVATGACCYLALLILADGMLRDIVHDLLRDSVTNSTC